MRFIKKILGKENKELTTVTKRSSDTGYVFVDVNNDLGQSVDDIMSSPDQVKMAYGYARKVAMAALRIQGLVDADNYDHAVSMFKSLQAQTGHTVEFQEAAFSEAVEYIKSYHPIISSLLLKNMVAIAEGYELPGIELDDSQLFESVLETIHAEQDDHGNSSDIDEKGSAGETQSCGIKPDSRALDGPDYRPKLNEIYDKLLSISEKSTCKTCKIMVMPSDGSFWSWDFEFSDQDMDEVHGIIEELYTFCEGWIQAPVFQITE